MISGLMLVVAQARAQDIIYQVNGKKVDCKIIDIGPQKVKYKIPQNPGPAYSMEAGDVLMAFSSTGNFVVYPISSGDAQAASFLNPPTNKQYDILITVDNQVVAAIELNLTEKEANNVSLWR